MSAVQPTTARQSGEAFRLLEDRGVGGDLVQRTMIQRPNEVAGLMKALDARPELMVEVVSLFEGDPDLLATKVAEAQAELAARPRFGDWLLAERGITVIDGGQRGQTLPAETPLTSLKPVGFLREGDGDRIRGTQMQECALDKSGPCYAPWGRDLLWRVKNNKDGEGDAFLATLDKSKYYVLAGDKDLQRSGGDQVVLYLGCGDGSEWVWNCNWLGSSVWGANDQLFTLGNSSS